MQDLWIFGYGSLIFKADFPFTSRRPALLPSWNRRFWQASTDHRGTPEFAGRVVTLVRAPNESCWGMAYQIAAADVEGVLTHLDYREKGGYQRLDATLSLEQGGTIQAITYHADEHNPEFLGEAPLDEMATQIVNAVGPSGANVDYLFNLEQSLKQHDVMDTHVFELASAVRSLLKK